MDPHFGHNLNHKVEPMGYMSDDDTIKPKGPANMSAFKEIAMVKQVEKSFPQNPKPYEADVQTRKDVSTAGKVNEKDSMSEEHSNLRIKNRVLPSVVVRERLSDSKFIQLQKLRFAMVGGKISGSWVTIGVLGEKGHPSESSSGNKYSRWKICLLDSTSYTLFLFGKAYADHWKETPGSIIAIIDADILPPNKGYDASLKVSNSNQIMKLGTSIDYGICKGEKKSGARCNAIIDTRKGNFCTYHVGAAYKKIKPVRIELGGGNFAAAPFLVDRKRVRAIAEKEPIEYKRQKASKLVNHEKMQEILKTKETMTSRSISQGARILAFVSSSQELKPAKSVQKGVPNVSGTQSQLQSSAHAAGRHVRPQSKGPNKLTPMQNLQPLTKVPAKQMSSEATQGDTESSDFLLSSSSGNSDIEEDSNLHIDFNKQRRKGNDMTFDLEDDVTDDAHWTAEQVLASFEAFRDPKSQIAGLNIAGNSLLTPTMVGFPSSRSPNSVANEQDHNAYQAQVISEAAEPLGLQEDCAGCGEDEGHRKSSMFKIRSGLIPANEVLRAAGGAGSKGLNTDKLDKPGSSSALPGQQRQHAGLSSHVTSVGPKDGRRSVLPPAVQQRLPDTATGSKGSAGETSYKGLPSGAKRKFEPREGVLETALPPKRSLNKRPASGQQDPDATTGAPTVGHRAAHHDRILQKSRETGLRGQQGKAGALLSAPLGHKGFSRKESLESKGQGSGGPQPQALMSGSNGCPLAALGGGNPSASNLGKGRSLLPEAGLVTDAGRGPVAPPEEPPQAWVHHDRAQVRAALEIIKLTGGLKPVDPNAVGARKINPNEAPSTGKHAALAATPSQAAFPSLEDCSHAASSLPPPGTRHLPAVPRAGSAGAFTAAFADVAGPMAAQESRYSDLVSQEDDEKMLSRMGVLAEKDAMQQTMAAVTKISISAWRCRECKSMWERKPAECSKRSHHLTFVKTATKYFFECASCHAHVTTIDRRFPAGPCFNCRGCEFRPTSKYKGLKKGPSLDGTRESFQSRGKEHAFSLKTI